MTDFRSMFTPCEFGGCALNSSRLGLEALIMTKATIDFGCLAVARDGCCR